MRGTLCLFVLYVVLHAASVLGASTAMPVGNLKNWRQIFTEDFTTNVALGGFPGPYANKWTSYSGGYSTDDIGWYDKKILSVSNGLLDMYIHTDSTGRPTTAAPIPYINSDGKWGGQTYGRYSIRFRSDALDKYKTAFLLWPDSENWNEGEIDFPEGSLNGKISAFSHCNTGNPNDNCFWYNSQATYPTWHIATIEWAPRNLTFILDDVVVASTTSASAIPSTPFHWVLQVETWFSRPATTVAGHLQIDWACVWAYDTSIAGPTPTPKPPTPPTACPGIVTDTFSTLNTNSWSASSGEQWGQTVFFPKQVKAGSTGLVLNMTKSGCPTGCDGSAQQSGKVRSTALYPFGTVQVTLQSSPYATTWVLWEAYATGRDGYEVRIDGSGTTAKISLQYYTNNVYGWIGQYVLPFDPTTSARKYTISRSSTKVSLYANGVLIASSSVSGLPQKSANVQYIFQSDSAITATATTARIASFTYLPAGCPFTA